MAYADYAPCVICDGKAVYDPDDVVRDDVIVVHRRCYPRIAAAALRDERKRIAAELRSVADDPAVLRDWLDAHGLHAIGPGRVVIAVLRAVAGDVGSRLGGHPGANQRPRIVCLCGSTRFGEAFQVANLRETLAGRIVLSIGCDMRSDGEVFSGKTPAELEQIKSDLDELHMRKIDLADEVLVLNVGGYVGSSTRSEIEYAERLGKPVRYLETNRLGGDGDRT